ncbi:matrixin family metalloprotease [Pontiella sulfatireligans]|uniref:Peptidase M10 metallopeptidase domain-containing protein n=1 Tax=Pontiella sulfatireligans TaxID=2750658 RepID=A0A6C2USC7_9BACT|nr:matrixin family metalloprotease [Pontiella sulfatireligans]VGO21826.1 hypothetical protein SCARR_03903 [Pontiella sulfatireligans]
MKNYLHAFLAVWILSISSSPAAEFEQSFSDWVAHADAICRVAVQKNTAFEKPPHSAIYTETGSTVLETFKGIFADTVQLEHRGGELNGRGEVYCSRPVFETGHEYLLFIHIRADGTLEALKSVSNSNPEYAALLDQLRLLDEPGADVSNQTSQPSGGMTTYSVGILPGSTGVYASRFLQCDRGEPIEYLVDMDLLPSGITTNQAMTALENALAAWEAQTSLIFKFAGFESFGMTAADVVASDGRIRIQFHDSYGEITSATTLGRGGRGYTYSGAWPNGGLGAKVGTNEFDLTTRGYLTLEHTAASLSNPVSLEEVLCHELGHVLSLGHSSETFGESDSVLKEAQMYYLIHGDGRGAALNSWDTGNIDTIYPTNTPPYGYDRIIEAVTKYAPQHPFASGANQVNVHAYDLQGEATAGLLSENQYVGNGGFVQNNGSVIFFTPGGAYSDAQASPGSYYGRCFVRMDDGVNMSSPVEVRVVSFNKDSNGDLLPDSWASTYSVSGAAYDSDGDGLTNYEEWLLELDPTNAQSRLEVALSGPSLSWTAKPEELYQIQSTTNLLNGFSDEGNPALADSISEKRTVELGTQKFYRIQRLN